MSTGKFLPLDKFRHLGEAIKQSGGFWCAMWKLYRMDDLKGGKLIGKDKYGNKYYENKHFFQGRNRWIEYADHYYLDYDGSQIPADWYGWLHNQTDLPPHKDPSRPHHKWMADHVENLTATPGQFMPYSTVNPKIEVWNPSTSKAPLPKVCKM